MHVEEILPFEGSFVLPFIYENHWGILFTESETTGPREFHIITDRRAVFQAVVDRLQQMEANNIAKQEWYFSLMLEKHTSVAMRSFRLLPNADVLTRLFDQLRCQLCE